MRSGSREQKRSRYVLQRDELICGICGHFGADEVDHRIPLAEGGTDTDDNLQAVHAEPCHRLKSAAEAARARAAA